MKAKQAVALAFLARALTATPTSAQATYQPYTFTTLAGIGPGSADGTGSDARFYAPSGLAVDSTGNVYVADRGSGTVRKVTPAGAVTTLAGLAANFGSVDGIGSAARFSYPSGVAVDNAGNVYVADGKIRKVTPAGVVTTLSGLAGGSGVAVDNTGNVYVADSDNFRIRKRTPAGVVTTLAGGSFGIADGAGSAAQFRYPTGVAVDSVGNVYVTDQYNDPIRKVTPAGVVTTLAGLARGSSVAVDGADNVYVADGNTIRKVTPLGVVTPLPGLTGGSSVAVDGGGNVYVTDDNTIRKATPAGAVTTLAGVVSVGSADGTASDARFYEPSGVAVDSAGNVYVADQYNQTIRKVTPAGVVTTLAGLAGSPDSMDGTRSAARFNHPSGVALDGADNVYVADKYNFTIRKVTPAGAVTTVAGLAGSSGSADGTGSMARFGIGLGGGGPWGVAVDIAGNVYVGDSGNYTIRKVTPTGEVTTLAGLAGKPGSADGTGSAARFGGEERVPRQGPSGVAVDSAGNIYVADAGNFAIRKVTPDGVVTTLAGLRFHQGCYDCGSPYGVAVDSAGNIYAADNGNNTISKLTPTGVVTILAGLAGNSGGTDGTGTVARFGVPLGIATDAAGNIFVADTGNNTIRKGYPAAVLLSSGFNGGQFAFDLTGPAGQLVIVEASTDLMSWLPIWTNTFSRALNFSDRQNSVHLRRFYRAHLP